MELMSMKPVGGVETLGPASNPQNSRKKEAPKGVHRTSSKRTNLQIHEDLLNFLNLCVQQPRKLSNNTFSVRIEHFTSLAMNVFENNNHIHRNQIWKDLPRML